MIDQRLSGEGIFAQSVECPTSADEKRLNAAVHDFNNALQAVACTLAALQMRLRAEPDAENARLIEAALTSTNRARTQAQRLTTSLRSPGAVMEAFDAHALLRASETILTNLAGENVDLDFKLAEEDISIFCDATEFQNAVLNLVVNSKQAMPTGGRILIETVRMGRDWMAVHVTDTGSGMSAACVEKACMAYYTTKAPQDGSGLGLWSVRDFTERAGGELAIRSAEGLGTVVSMSLPRLRRRGNAAVRTAC